MSENQPDVLEKIHRSARTANFIGAVQVLQLHGIYKATQRTSKLQAETNRLQGELARLQQRHVGLAKEALAVQEKALVQQQLHTAYFEQKEARRQRQDDLKNAIFHIKSELTGLANREDRVFRYYYLASIQGVVDQLAIQPNDLEGLRDKEYAASVLHDLDMAVKSCASILDATDLHDIDIIENTEPEARVIKHTLASYSSRLVKNREGLTALVRDRQYVANLGSLLSHLGIIPNCASFGLIFAVLLIGVGIIYKINALTLIAGIAAVFFLVLMLVRGSHQSMLSDKKMYEIGIANDETEIAKLQPAYDQLEGRVAAVYVKRPELKSLLSSFRGNAASEEVQNVGVGLLGEDFGADPLYDKAVQLVLKEQKISIFLLHNHFKIGFDRASYLIEQMEREGIVSAMEASGHRKVVAR